MTEEQVQYVQIVAIVQELPEEQQAKVLEAVAAITAALDEHRECGRMALALVGAKLAAGE